MRHYKYNTINKTQKTVAYLLLSCQLLTSCGGKTTLLPRDPNVQPIQAVHEQLPTCTDDNPQPDQPCPAFPITTRTITGNTLIFSYTPDEGLSTFYQPMYGDSKMEKISKHLPIQQYTILMDVDGVRKSFKHFPQEEARFFATTGKWEVSQAGELRYLGIRARGGMGKQGSYKGGESKGKARGEGKTQDTGECGGKGVVQEHGKGLGGQKAARQSGDNAGAGLSKATANASRQSEPDLGESASHNPGKSWKSIYTGEHGGGIQTIKLEKLRNKTFEAKSIASELAASETYIKTKFDLIDNRITELETSIKEKSLQLLNTLLLDDGELTDRVRAYIDSHYNSIVKEKDKFSLEELNKFCSTIVQYKTYGEFKKFLRYRSTLADSFSDTVHRYYNKERFLAKIKHFILRINPEINKQSEALKKQKAELCRLKKDKKNGVVFLRSLPSIQYLQKVI